MSGLRTPFRDGYVKHIAEDVIQLAKDGLERRGYKETGFLNEVAEVVRTGINLGLITDQAFYPRVIRLIR